MKIEMTSVVDITVEKLAEIFAALDDDQMCKFFVEVARISKTWDHSDNQWYYLGGHLRNCECSTQDARDMISSIHEYMNTSTHQ